MKLFSRKKKEAPKIPSEIFTNNLNDFIGLPQGIPGGFDIEGQRFFFHDAASFYFSYLEIMKEEIYRFETNAEHPLILDCGANMGVSVLYFSRLYPQSKIIAFEPEHAIYEVLEKNVASFNLSNVELQKKAVWDKETVLNFTTDHGMGGSVTNVYTNQQPTEVRTVRLADYLQQRIAFLKLDIEGAEYTVIKDCEPYLHNVDHVFVECHSYINQEQKLEEVLSILKNAGYRYHLRQSFSRNKPFVEKMLACENMDMAINVFAYREK